MAINLNGGEITRDVLNHFETTWVYCITHTIEANYSFISFDIKKKNLWVGFIIETRISEYSLIRDDPREEKSDHTVLVQYIEHPKYNKSYSF